jgi:hypothetical protein
MQQELADFAFGAIGDSVNAAVSREIFVSGTFCARRFFRRIRIDEGAGQCKTFLPKRLCALNLCEDGLVGKGADIQKRDETEWRC